MVVLDENVVMHLCYAMVGKHAHAHTIARRVGKKRFSQPPSAGESVRATKKADTERRNAVAKTTIA